jgi:hypothetical protein
MTRPRPIRPIKQDMKGPGQQPCEPAPDPVIAAMEAAALFRAGDDRNGIACLLLAHEPLRVAVAACKLLGAALEGLDRTRCHAVVICAAQGHVAAIFRVLRRPPRTRRAAACGTR